MIDTISATLQPIIVETLLALILAAIAWLGRYLPAKMRIEIEAKHRLALHSALSTGTAYALDALEAAIRANPAIAVGDATIAKVIGYVEKSVPDALKNLNPGPGMLHRMAQAKLAEALTAMGVDPLTQALRDAGAYGGSNGN